MLLKAKNEHVWRILLVMSVLLFVPSCYLFYKFINGTYMSDFIAHISASINGEGSYSLMHFLIKLCYALPFPEIVLSVVMSLITVGTGIGIYTYLNLRAGEYYPAYVLVPVSFAVLFTSNLYLIKLMPHFYTRYTPVSQPWHNSTYILMRFFAVWVIVFFFVIYDKIKNDKLELKDCILFCVFLSLCNFSKPNFFIAFAPAALVIFVLLLVKAKGKNFVKLFEWGCCFILSTPCLLYMTSVVYDAKEQSSLAISSKDLLDYVLGSAASGNRGHFPIYEISNLAFPLFVLVVFLVLKKRREDIKLDRLLTGFLLFFFGHIEQLILTETGPRSTHGNYAWGVYCVGMILFMICLGEWLRAYSEGKLKNRLVFSIGSAVFSAHILCGIEYFTFLLQGSFYIV